MEFCLSKFIFIFLYSMLWYFCLISGYNLEISLKFINYYHILLDLFN